MRRRTFTYIDSPSHSLDRTMKRLTILGLLIFPIVVVNADNQKLHSIKQLSDASNLVVVGTITSVTSSEVTTGSDTLIVTDCTVTINETIKGSGSSPLTIRVEGGTVAGVTMGSTSMPPVYVGQRAIWFLSSISSGRRTLIGKGLGFFQLNADDTVFGRRGWTLAIIRQQAM